MQPGMTVHAKFISNPFTPVAGIYNGLFSETNGFRHESAGFVSILVGAKGIYSGYLVFDGDSKVSFSGKWTASAAAPTRSVARVGKAPVQMSLAIDWSPDSGQITGVVSNENWSSPMLAMRAKFDAKALPPVLDSTNFMGRYTMQIPRGLGSPTAAPGGVGYGTITNSAGGIIQLLGKLGDSGPKQKIEQKVNISRHGDWPLYVGLYPSTATYSNVWTTNTLVTKKTYYLGAMMGWLKFSSNNASVPPTNDLIETNIVWVKTTMDTNNYPLAVPTNAVYYANGFSNEIGVVSSAYVTPGLNELPIKLDVPAQVVVSDGNLSEPVTNMAVSILTNKITLSKTTTNSGAVPSTNMMTIAITKKDGYFTGNFLRPGDALKTEFFGVVLQNTTNAQGHFLGTTNSGHVILTGTPHP